MDRDGTLIRDVVYPADPEAVELLPGAVAGLHTLRDMGFALVVVSNQSGVGRGLIRNDQAAAVHERVVELLQREGLRLDGWYYCPHAPEEGCDCRKPSPGLITRASADLGIDPTRSYVIGDKESDMELARRVGSRGIRFGGAAGGWREAVQLIRGPE